MVQLTDPADTAKAFGEIDFEVVKLGAGRFLVKRVVVDLDGALGPWQKLFPILGWTQRVVPLRQGRGFFDVE